MVSIFKRLQSLTLYKKLKYLAIFETVTVKQQKSPLFHVKQCVFYNKNGIYNCE